MAWTGFPGRFQTVGYYFKFPHLFRRDIRFYFVGMFCLNALWCYWLDWSRDLTLINIERWELVQIIFCGQY
jgi:hypothetical protein